MGAADSLAMAAESTGAALVTVVSALYSYGVIGKAESHNSIGNLGAAWVGLASVLLNLDEFITRE